MFGSAQRRDATLFAAASSARFGSRASLLSGFSRPSRRFPHLGRIPLARARSPFPRELPGRVLHARVYERSARRARLAESFVRTGYDVRSEVVRSSLSCPPRSEGAGYRAQRRLPKRVGLPYHCCDFANIYRRCEPAVSPRAIKVSERLRNFHVYRAGLPRNSRGSLVVPEALRTPTDDDSARSGSSAASPKVVCLVSTCFNWEDIPRKDRVGLSKVGI